MPYHCATTPPIYSKLLRLPLLLLLLLVKGADVRGGGKCRAVAAAAGGGGGVSAVDKHGAMPPREVNIPTHVQSPVRGGRAGEEG